MRWTLGSAGAIQPGCKVTPVVEVEQSFRKGFQALQGKGAHTGLQLWAQVSATATQLAQGEPQPTLLSPLLPSFLSPLQPPLAKDLPLGHALAEVLQGDAAHGAKLRDRPAIERCDLGSGDHSGDRFPLAWACHFRLKRARAGGTLLLRLRQEGQGPQQWRRGGILGRRLQLQPVRPLPHKLRHSGGTAEIQAAVGADHHHPPLLNRRLLLQQAGALGKEPSQKLGIRAHLRLQQHGWQRRLIRGRLKQTIQPVFPLLSHRRGEPPATGFRRQIGLQLKDSIGVRLEQPVEKFVAGDHGGQLSWWDAQAGRRPMRRSAGGIQTALVHPLR